MNSIMNDIAIILVGVATVLNCTLIISLLRRMRRLEHRQFVRELFEETAPLVRKTLADYKWSDTLPKGDKVP